MLFFIFKPEFIYRSYRPLHEVFEVRPDHAAWLRDAAFYTALPLYLWLLSVKIATSYSRTRCAYICIPLSLKFWNNYTIYNEHSSVSIWFKSQIKCIAQWKLVSGLSFPQNRSYANVHKANIRTNIVFTTRTFVQTLYWQPGRSFLHLFQQLDAKPNLTVYANQCLTHTIIWV
jgi:hypothetical protein